jgi:hypothetical protein
MSYAMRLASLTLLLAGFWIVGRGSLAQETPTAPPPSAPPAAAAPSAPAKVPKLEIDKEIMDLGDLVRGTKAEATFVIRNSGQETLKILSAKPG